LSQNPPANTSALITWLVATFGGLSVLLYLAGIVAVTMRLVFYQLPFENAIADLPQSYFATVALIEMLLPSLFVAGLYLLARNLLQLAVFGPLRYNPQEPKTRRRWVWGAATAGWVILLLYFAVIREGNPLIFWQFWVFGSFVAVGISAVSYELALIAPSTSGTTGASGIPPRTHGLTVATIALLVAMAALPYEVAFNSSAQLDDVKICPEVAGQTAWRLIGENGDRIWVGERAGSNRHVVWLPLKSAQSVWIGLDVAGRTCPPPSAVT
jgi:hypothetical protein